MKRHLQLMILSKETHQTELLAVLGLKNFRKIARAIKLTICTLLILSLNTSAKSYAQKVSLNEQNANLKTIFKELRKQTGYYFIYTDEMLSKSKPVSIKTFQKELEEVLIQVFIDQPLTYSVQENVIVVKDKPYAKNVKTLKDVLIRGIVSSSQDGAPLVGVSVKVKGMQNGTITNLDGSFAISVSEDAKILQFTYLGYTMFEANIATQKDWNINLVLESKQLDEVIVAFGTSEKREITSSIGQISSKELEQRPISNLNSALAGALPGVQTDAGSGQPGEGPSIRIRGFGSINNANSPLYVVDGAPYEGVISNINPDDIETISVLKDASASSLYGARAANGVILISTKKGKSNRNNFQLKLQNGVTSRALPNYEKVNAFEYYPLMWESYRNSEIASGVALEQANLNATANIKEALGFNPFNVKDNAIVGIDGNIDPDAKLLYADDLSWKKAIERTGIRQDYNMSLSGGAAKSDYYVSLGLIDDKGFAKGSDFTRVNGRVRVNAQPKSWLKVGLNVSGNTTNTNQANESSGINENPFFIDLVMGPIYPVHQHDPITGAFILDEKGNKIYDSSDQRRIFGGRNVIAETQYNVNQIQRNAISTVANTDINILKNLKLSLSSNYTINNYRNEVFDNRLVGDAIGAGRTTRTNTISKYWNFNQLINYTASYKKSSFKVLVGHENYLNNYDYLSGSRRGMIVDGTTVLDNFTTTTNLSSYNRDYKTEGYLSRIEYNFDGKYVINGSFRRDGSSKFHPDNRWGNFWSTGFAYNIDREKFFKANWIDLLKLRGSYGLVGSDNLSGYFLYQSLYTLGYSNGTESGMILSSIPSPNLKWESTQSADLALEVDMFDRISTTIEVFRRESKNLLFDLPLPLTSGLLSRNVNLGGMRNEGVELQLGIQAVKKKAVKWNVDINLTRFKNKITELPAEYEGRINGTKRYAVGESMYQFYLRDWYGVDPDNGLDLYYAADKLTTSSRVIKGTDTLTTNTSNAFFDYKGSAIPDIYGSIKNTLNYNRFSLDFTFMFQLGGKTFDNDYQNLMYRGNYGRALHVDALKRWQKPGDITDVARRIESIVQYDSDRYLIDASYLNLRTASLTYSLSKKTLNKLKVQNARVYLSAENLFITSNRKGLDPTQTYTGSASYTYAPTRIVNLGINLTL